MQNTFSQSGNDSKWFLIKIIFQNRYMALETPPLHGKCHLKFPFWFSAPLPKMDQRKKNKICFDLNWKYDNSFLNRRQTWAIRKWKRGFPQRAKYLSALVTAITLTTACQTLAVPKQNFIESWERLYFDWFVLISRFGLYLAEAGECQQGVVFLNCKGKTSTCRWSGRRRYLPIFFCVTINACVDLQILL